MMTKRRTLIVVGVLVVAGLAVAHWYFSDRGRFTTEPEFTGLSRTVSGNDLISEKDPAAVLRFDPVFRHIGGQKFILYGVADTEQHFFVETTDDDKLKSVYWIQYEAYLPGKRYTYDYDDSPLRVTLGDYEFYTDTDVVEFDPQRKRRRGTDGAMARRFLASKGYSLPREWAYARLVYLTDESRQKELMIIFIDDLTAHGLAAAELESDAARWREVERAHLDRISSTLSVLPLTAREAPHVFAFTSTRTGNHDVFVASVGHDSAVNLTNHPATDYGLSWSPDGTRLLFGTDRDGNRELYVMDADGGNLRNLTRHAALDAAPDWSDDGEKIVFVSDRDTDSRELYMMDVDGSNVVRVTENDRYEEAPALSPDGRQIAFGAIAGTAGGDEALQVFVIDVTGENERQLTRLPGHNSAPSWSPDGQRLAFYGQVGEGFSGADIFVMATDGSELTNLTNDAEPDWQPDWSPDGQWIIFSRGPGDPLDLWVMRSDGTERRQLVSADGRDEQPAWRPDLR